MITLISFVSFCALWFALGPLAVRFALGEANPLKTGNLTLKAMPVIAGGPFLWSIAAILLLLETPERQSRFLSLLGEVL